MADKKISALTGATTPLAGTEVLPIVQGAATVKVPVSDLTAGRAVSSLSLSTGLATSSGTGAYFNSNLSTETGTPTNQYGLYVNRSSGAGATTTNVYGIRVNTLDFAAGKNTTNAYGVYIGGVYATNSYGIYQALPANQNYFAGNIVVGTAANGVNFTANTPAAGMTSQLLNAYEEGTWTPTDASGAALSLTGTATNCFYTKIGNQVTCIFSLTYPSTVSAASATIGGLPFTSKNTGNSVAGGITTYISNGSVITFLIGSNDTIIYIRSISGVSAVTNASLSTAQIRGIVQYLV